MGGHKVTGNTMLNANIFARHDSYFDQSTMVGD